MLEHLPKSQLLKRWQPVLLKQPSHTIVLAVLLTIGLFAPQVAMNWRIYGDLSRIRQQEQRLQHLNDRATYLDEVLTMSALMNAATGDRSWENRYHEFVPQLDEVIKESIHLVPDVYSSDDAKQVDAANQALIALELKSFQLVQHNQQQEALQLLTSAEYKAQKKIYAAGVAQRDARIQQQLQLYSHNYQTALMWSLVIMATSILLLVPTWLAVLQMLRSYLHDRRVAESALHKKNQDLTEALNQLHQAQHLIQQQTQHFIQTEKLSSLGQLVAGVAHEINNPNNFIKGNLFHIEQYSQELLKLIGLFQQNVSYLPAEIQAEVEELDLTFIADDLPKILRSIELGTLRIEEVVTGLKTFSHLDESERKTIELHSNLESTISLLRHRLHKTLRYTEIQLIREYGDLPKVECCPSQLNQVFYSILSNAIEAIEQAKPQRPVIRIETKLINENNEKWVKISISDNGDGIESEIQAKIFDPFFTTKPIGQGKGLGLSISHQIVTKYHHGKLYYTSTQAGTKFFIEIPLPSEV
ncbi:ATP-binding protein [Leptolyngbya sp. DQ-M1]|uniref:sensor histidine kinase n=1 Tax=Leptolyngbya sp. DQ-M1 TaxID=2933920 RepID=UPI00329754E5